MVNLQPAGSVFKRQGVNRKQVDAVFRHTENPIAKVEPPARSAPRRSAPNIDSSRGKVEVAEVVVKCVTEIGKSQLKAVK